MSARLARDLPANSSRLMTTRLCCATNVVIASKSWRTALANEQASIAVRSMIRSMLMWSCYRDQLEPKPMSPNSLFDKAFMW